MNGLALHDQLFDERSELPKTKNRGTLASSCLYILKHFTFAVAPFPPPTNPELTSVKI